MLHSFSVRSLLLTILVLGSCLSNTLCQEDEPDEQEPPTEAEPEPEPEPEPIPEPPEETTVAATPHVEGGLTLEECKNPGNETKEKCCKDNLDIDDAIMKCFVLHQKKMPKDNEQNPALLIKFFSCLIECVYKSKKYIAKGDTLNMKMIKSDANKKYKSNEVEKDYMVAMYEHCERDAANTWSSLKKNVAARVIFTGACKPFYMLVFVCVMDYPKKVSCPHFKWKGKKEYAETCVEMKAKCEQLQG